MAGWIDWKGSRENGEKRRRSSKEEERQHEMEVK